MFYMAGMMAAGSLSLLRLSVLRGSSKESPIVAAVIFQSWFDDSERDDMAHNVSALGGCVGSEAQWKRFDTLWRKNVLDKFKIDYLHMKELFRFEGMFAKFQAPELRIDLTKEIVGAISNSSLRPFVSMIRLRDLRRFNRVHRQQLHHYSLNIYTCMLYVTMIYRDYWDSGIIQMNLDRIAKPSSKIQLALEYAKTNAEWSRAADFIYPYPVPPGVMRSLPALQAADFIAWECRKDVEGKDGWYESRLDGLLGKDYDRFFGSEWAADQGKSWPFPRKSMGLFVRNTKVVLWCWTYDLLTQMNAGRQGVWTTAAATLAGGRSS